MFGIINKSMSLKIFFLLIILGTVFSGFNLVFILANFDPNQISFFTFLLFYLSLFFTLAGLIFLISDWLKKKILKNQLWYQRVRTSIRHAIFFSLILTGWAFLKSQKLLRWWVLILFILILTALEFFFISLQKPKTIYEGKN